MKQALSFYILYRVPAQILSNKRGKSGDQIQISRMKLANLSKKYKDKLSGFTAEEIYHTAALYAIYNKGLNNSRVKECERKRN